MSGLRPFWASVYIVLSASYINKENPVYRTDTETPLEKMEPIVLNSITECRFHQLGQMLFDRGSGDVTAVANNRSIGQSARLHALFLVFSNDPSGSIQFESHGFVRESDKTVVQRGGGVISGYRGN
jgi:hypothetical protein